jgi:hypothetical protein
MIIKKKRKTYSLTSHNSIISKNVQHFMIKIFTGIRPKLPWRSEAFEVARQALEWCDISLQT